MQIVREYVSKAVDQGLSPDRYIVHGKQANLVDIEEAATGTRRQVLSFCSNDVLGLAQEASVKQAAIDAILRYGTSNSACSTLSGRIDLHRELEREISAFKDLPHTQLFLNAWMAMQALLDGFCHLALPVPGFKQTRETLILTDVRNHASIVSAVTNAGMRSGKLFGDSPPVRVKPYLHCDVGSLAQMLRHYARPNDRIMVITDSVFSMDGDVAPLPEILEVLRAYPGSVLVLDEAHASGAIGPTGGGIFDHFGLSPQELIRQGIAPVIMTTFSKFAGSAGAAISTHIAELVPLLDVSPTSIGTVSLPPPATAAALASFRYLRRHPERVAALQEHTRTLRSQLTNHGFELLGETNVIPVILPTAIDPKHFARDLMTAHGIWVSPIWFIARPRLRITVNALHTPEQLDRLVEGMARLRDRDAGDGHGRVAPGGSGPDQGGTGAASRHRGHDG